MSDIWIHDLYTVGGYIVLGGALSLCMWKLLPERDIAKDVAALGFFFGLGTVIVIRLVYHFQALAQGAGV